mmetsp:Transcript_2688/g.8986  ORF Transcript_2688/g.8986 Transcript_2688/m.8986 type:complete len:213 (+) Transcript_2688:811-1449(+)
MGRPMEPPPRESSRPAQDLAAIREAASAPAGAMGTAAAGRAHPLTSRGMDGRSVVQTKAWVAALAAAARALTSVLGVATATSLPAPPSLGDNLRAQLYALHRLCMPRLLPLAGGILSPTSPAFPPESLPSSPRPPRRHPLCLRPAGCPGPAFRQPASLPVQTVPAEAPRALVPCATSRRAPPTWRLGRLVPALERNTNRGGSRLCALPIQLR